MKYCDIVKLLIFASLSARHDKRINELANLESLRVLNLQRSSVSGTLPPFNSTSSLRVLNLGQNNLEGSIPSSYGHMKKLEELILVSQDYIYKSTLFLLSS